MNGFIQQDWTAFIYTLLFNRRLAVAISIPPSNRSIGTKREMTSVNFNGKYKDVILRADRKNRGHLGGALKEH